MPDLEVVWTAPTDYREPARTFSDACATAVTQSAKAGVSTSFHFAGYIYIVNAAKHDEDVRDA